MESVVEDGKIQDDRRYTVVATLGNEETSLV